MKGKSKSKKSGKKETTESVLEGIDMTSLEGLASAEKAIADKTDKLMETTLKLKTKTEKLQEDKEAYHTALENITETRLVSGNKDVLPSTNALYVLGTDGVV